MKIVRKFHILVVRKYVANMLGLLPEHHGGQQSPGWSENPGGAALGRLACADP